MSSVFGRNEYRKCDHEIMPLKEAAKNHSNRKKGLEIYRTEDVFGSTINLTDFVQNILRQLKINRKKILECLGLLFNFSNAKKSTEFCPFSVLKRNNPEINRFQGQLKKICRKLPS